MDALFYVHFLFSVELPWGRLSARKGNERKMSFWRKVVRSVTSLFVGCTDLHNRTLSWKVMRTGDSTVVGFKVLQ